MDHQKAKALLSQGRAIYADLGNGQRHRIIGIGSKHCHSVSGRSINLTSVTSFN